MKKFRRFVDLSRDEFKQIVTDLFNPLRITNIKYHKRQECISCTICTEWEFLDDDGNRTARVVNDVLTLSNPFDYGEDSIDIDIVLSPSDYLVLKKFCVAKDIVCTAWITDNPYI